MPIERARWAAFARAIQVDPVSVQELPQVDADLLPYSLAQRFSGGRKSCVKGGAEPTEAAMAMLNRQPFARDRRESVAMK